MDSKFSASEYGTQILTSIMGERETFQYPKSPYAVMECIRVATNKKYAVVLDFFAGSGTTGHAVLNLNQEDEGKRTFIICTNDENNIASKVCYPRIKKVIKGWGENKGLGGSLKYFKTKFIKRSANIDDFKTRITDECVEMLCLRENVFDDVKTKKDYRIFQYGDKVMAIYNALERNNLKELKKELDKIEGDKILYCFTLDPLGLDKKDFMDWNGVKLEPIPQKVLDVYKQIYEY